MEINKKVIISNINPENELFNKTGKIVGKNIHGYKSDKCIVLLNTPLNNGDIAIVIHKMCLKIL